MTTTKDRTTDGPGTIIDGHTVVAMTALEVGDLITETDDQSCWYTVTRTSDKSVWVAAEDYPDATARFARNPRAVVLRHAPTVTCDHAVTNADCDHYS